MKRRTALVAQQRKTSQVCTPRMSPKSLKEQNYEISFLILFLFLLFLGYYNSKPMTDRRRVRFSPGLNSSRAPLILISVSAATKSF